MMGIQYSQDVPNGATTPIPVNLIKSLSISKNISPIVQGSILPLIHIEKGFLIAYEDSKNARVLHAFYIKLRFIEERFIATSEISDVYEEGQTLKEAVIAYLKSLVDELLWFQRHEATLSGSLLHDFRRLQFFVDVV